ncbi:MAG TPA: ATP-binding protein [Desulfobacterales bacterium]|nr:ATP-binding protein [Desulfobacterales bacterium]
MELVTRFFSRSRQSFFLFGPRGTGKSTWLRQHYPDAVMIDLLAPEVYREYTARPERLREIAAGAEGKIIIIDEVQKIPELLDVVHGLIEGGVGLQFILTSSSARKLKRTGVDLLAGRAIVKTMHPFMASELKGSFSLAKSLKFGMVPLIVNSLDPAETLASYVALYLREEVQMEGIVRNIGAFSRFLEAVSFSHGSTLNVSDVARECQVKRKTVDNYLSILDDLLLSFQLPVFSRRAKRHLISHPKFYYFDSGVFQSLRPAGPLDSPQEIDGGALEGLVAQHLRAWIAYSNNASSLYYWRTKSGVEVDFVLYGENTFLAIEVKNSTRINSKMLKGLKTFKDDYPEAQAMILYRGEERLVINDILCLPCDQFLQQLIPGEAIIANPVYA